jgi:hypothetical protein
VATTYQIKSPAEGGVRYGAPSNLFTPTILFLYARRSDVVGGGRGFIPKRLVGFRMHSLSLLISRERKKAFSNSYSISMSKGEMGKYN